MTERGQVWELADRIQMDLRAAQARMVELRSILAALNLPADAKPPRPGSPHELAPGVCPECHLAPGVHAGDCPHATRNQENP